MAIKQAINIIHVLKAQMQRDIDLAVMLKDTGQFTDAVATLKTAMTLHDKMLNAATAELRTQDLEEIVQTIGAKSKQKVELSEEGIQLTKEYNDFKEAQIKPLYDQVKNLWDRYRKQGHVAVKADGSPKESVPAQSPGSASGSTNGHSPSPLNDSANGNSPSPLIDSPNGSSPSPLIDSPNGHSPSPLNGLSTGQSPTSEARQKRGFTTALDILTALKTKMQKDIKVAGINFRDQTNPHLLADFVHSIGLDYSRGMKDAIYAYPNKDSQQLETLRKELRELNSQLIGLNSDCVKAIEKLEKVAAAAKLATRIHQRQEEEKVNKAAYDTFILALGELTQKASYLEGMKKTDPKNYELAAKTATALVNKLTGFAEQYYLNHTIKKVGLFKENCNDVINAAKPILEVHRGFGKILSDLAFWILSIGTLGAANVVSKLFITKDWRFFKVPATDSMQKLEKFQHGLEDDFKDLEGAPATGG